MFISPSIYLPAAICFTHTTHFLGTYHQYDTVVYPKHLKPPKTLYERTREKVKSALGIEGSKEEELEPFQIGKLCLHIYLDGYKQKLCCGSFPQEPNLQNIVQGICHIFNCLHHPVMLHLLYQSAMLYGVTPIPQPFNLGVKFTKVCLFPCRFATFSSSDITSHRITIFLHTCR